MNNKIWYILYECITSLLKNNHPKWSWNHSGEISNTIYIYLESIVKCNLFSKYNVCELNQVLYQIITETLDELFEDIIKF